jgi:alanine racemase
MQGLRAPSARIDLDALRHNLAVARAAAPDSRIMAAVKADAYGHGLLRVARALAGADGFAVATIDEARALREGGITQPILALQGPRDADEVAEAARHAIALCIHQPGHLEMLAGAEVSAPVAVWLKVDSGMHRLGFPALDVREVYARLVRLAQVQGPPRLMTHLACADDPDSPMTGAQIEAFDAAIAGLAGEQSIANSAGLLAFPRARRDWVRPGIMLYGASPLLDRSARSLGLRPVMALTAPLIAIQRLRRGDTVGYGATWRCPEDMPVGIAAIGYGDGYPRSAGNGGPVRIGEQASRLLGRVSMDVLTVDLRGIEAQVGDEVLLWGEGLPVDEVATAADALSYELLCRIGGRVRVEVVGEEVAGRGASAEG